MKTFKCTDNYGDSFSIKGEMLTATSHNGGDEVTVIIDNNAIAELCGFLEEHNLDGSTVVEITDE